MLKFFFFLQKARNENCESPHNFSANEKGEKCLIKIQIDKKYNLLYLMVAFCGLCSCLWYFNRL